jgi:hypothetical protein
MAEKSKIDATTTKDPIDIAIKEKQLKLEDLERRESEYRTRVSG